MNKPPRQNSEAEFEAFCSVCDRLGGFDRQTTPEWADGYLTAMAVGARAVPLEQCLAKMAGDAYERAFADPEDRARAESALRARVAVLHDQLDAEVLFEAPDRLRLAPFMMAWNDEDRAAAVADGSVDAEDADKLVTGAEWVEGFMAAVNDFGSEWPQADGEDELAYTADLVGQLAALRLPEGSDELRKHLVEVYGEEGADRERLVDEACFAVQDQRMWVVDHAPKPQTRRVEKTPGRNDPCPCGSGKKYKKCHGAGA